MPKATIKEKRIQDEIFKMSEMYGVDLFRNNVGTFRSLDGKRFVRVGLCKGSADLVGITPVVITEEHVGRKLGIFTSVETKTAVGKLSSEQSIWLDYVLEQGGIACVATSLEDVIRAVQEFKNVRIS